MTSSPASADCSVEETPTGSLIICHDSILGEISGTSGIDIIHVLPEASILYQLTESGNNLTEARLVGINGLQGDDYITNKGVIEELQARAETTAVGVSLTIDGVVEGDPSGDALSDSSATADASATGIDSGADNDTIDNQADISADVQAVVDATGVATDITITSEGNASGAALSIASVTANAAATGIEGGSGIDEITNRGDIALNANTEATGVAVSLDVAGTIEGNAEGSSVSDASVTAKSKAIGIDGGEGDDTIVNSENITAHAGSTVTGVSAGLTISGTVGVNSDATGDVSRSIVSDASTVADATTTGIDGGDGDNSIINAGDLVSIAGSTAKGVAATLGITGTVGINSDTTGDVSSSTVSDTSANANATATGIKSGDGNDTITNSENITANAGSTATGVAAGLTISGSVDIALEKNEEDDTPGVEEEDESEVSSSTVSDASSNADAKAMGIEGGDGEDSIMNADNITSIAGSTATGVAATLGITGVVGVNSDTEGELIGSTVSNSSATANTHSVGIDGGTGADSIMNAGNIASIADSQATAVSASLNIVGEVAFNGKAESDISGSAASDASANANATVAGINGDAGDDTVGNMGTIIAVADSNAVGVAASLDISGKVVIKSDEEGDIPTIEPGADDEPVAEGDVSSEAMSNAGANADATATGIDGGSGNDSINNTEVIAASADSTATGVSAALNVGAVVAIKSGADVETSGVAVSDMSATSTAAATGIDGGLGNDAINNHGMITVMNDGEEHVDASATGVSAALNIEAVVSFEGEAKANVSGAALSDGSTTSTATATGIDGGDGGDTLVNTGYIIANPGADATGVTAALGIAATVSIKEDSDVEVSGETLSDTSVTAVVQATGIDGGEGDDIIINTGTITLMKSGDSEDEDIDASATGVSAALGITAHIQIESDAEVDISGSTMTDARTTANAKATAIDGGDGNDTIVNSGDIIANPDSDATGVGVTVDISGALIYKGTATGDVSSKAVSDTRVEATATATGIDAGDGDDTITNHGGIELSSDASSTNVAVDVSISGAVTIKGAALIEEESQALNDARATAAATAIGLDGGEGSDIIDNVSTIGVSSHADADPTSVTANITGNMGLADGSSASDSSGTATARSIGIDGGMGIDAIDNTGDITAISTASVDATSVTVSITGNMGLTEGSSVSNSSGTAIAQSIGIDGGMWDDDIDNGSTITATSYADADATSVDVDVSCTLGLSDRSSVSDSSGTAIARSIGINGGMGIDAIDNAGDITATSTAMADAASTVVSVTSGIAGQNVVEADSSATAVAQSIGISGGEEEDTITNTEDSTINTTSISTTEADNVIVGIVFGIGSDNQAESDASTVSRAFASGIDGGDGRDIITNEGDLFATATSNTTVNSTTVNINFLGKATSTADTSVISEAFATGIDGGAGDDLIKNRSLIDVNSNSTVTMDSYGFSLFGTGEAGGTLGARILATGIAGGDGMDEIVNEDAITVDISSILLAVGDSNIVFGTADVGSTSGAATEAMGIDGGADDDLITNLSLIDVDSNSTVLLNNDSFALGGTGEAGGTLEAGTILKGIFGGSGSDDIWNDGAIIVDAGSSLSADGGSVTIFGTADAANTASAATEAVGIDGGADDDLIVNEEESLIDVTAGSTVTLNNDSFTFGGTGETGGTLEAITRAIGIAGGDGLDEIWNDGSIIADAASDLLADGGSVTIFGTADIGSTSTAAAEAAGIDGGANDDLIVNQDDSLIDVIADSTVTLNNDSFTFGGTGEAGGTLEARTTSKGIFGGDGLDEIRNRGAIMVDASSDLLADGGAVTIFGTADVGSTSGAAAEAAGINGGADDDLIVNEEESLIDVTADSTVTLNNDSFTFGGTGETGGTLEAITRAIGIAGGDGLDEIRNEGTIEVGTQSFIQTVSGSDVVFGTSEVGAEATAETTVVGIAGGYGNDLIVNEGDIILDPAAIVYFSGSSWQAIGTADANATFSARGQSIGIDGGSGDDIILNGGEDILLNEGSMKIYNTSSAKTDGESYAGLGTSKGSGTTKSSSSATGIDSGDGDDTIVNMQELTVEAMSLSESIGSSETVFGVPRAAASAEAEASAVGINSGNGYDTIENADTIDVDSHAEAKGSADTYSDLGDRASYVYASASATADGIRAPEGAEMITTSGIIDVKTVARSTSRATSTGGPFEAHATAETNAESIAHGIRTGGGPDVEDINTHVLIDGGEVRVEAEAEATSVTWAEEDSGGEWAISIVDATAKAYGVVTGGGDDIVENNGLIDVKTNVIARASASTEDDDEIRNDSVDIEMTALGIDVGDGNNIVDNDGSIDVTMAAIAEDRRLLFLVDLTEVDIEMMAWGINAGNGNNVIENHGDINIGFILDIGPSLLSDITAATVGINTGSGDNIIENHGGMYILAEASDGLGSFFLSDTRADAVGIKTGEGVDIISNNEEGIIEVTAYAGAGSLSTALAVASVTGMESGAGNDIITNSGAVTVRAYANAVGLVSVADADAVGIDTGEGNDTITNNGTITTSKNINGVITSGVGISSGEGHDQVFLLEASSVTGDIMLGEGDDWITFYENAALNSTLNGEDGIDTLTVGDRGAFTFKTEDSGDDVPKIENIERFEVNEGTLTIKGDLIFDPTNGELLIQVNGDKSFGSMNIEGAATLGNTLTVVKGPGAFVDGTAFTVLSADSLNGSFSNEILPGPVPLLSFQYQQTVDEGIVNVSALSFTTVATNQVERAIAGYLDRITPTATGDLSNVIGEFQILSMPEFYSAFASLSPNVYNNATSVSSSSTQQYVKTIQQRMHSLRASLKFTAADTRPGYGIWMQGFGQWGDQDPEDGYNGYDYDLYGGTLGVDRFLKDNVLLGFSLGASRADIDFENNLGAGDIDALMISLYGSWFTERYYLDASLSYGNQGYDITRNITIGSIERTAISDHDGSIFSGYLEGGYNFIFGRWMLGPFAVLNYLYNDEDGFTESGAGSINLSTDGRQTEALISQLGAVWAGRLTYENFEMMPELRLAWKHDFDIDDQVITSVFAGAPGVKFSIDGQDVEQNSLMFEAGVTLFSKNGLSVPIKYAAELRDGYTAHGIFGLIRNEF